MAKRSRRVWTSVELDKDGRVRLRAYLRARDAELVMAEGWRGTKALNRWLRRLVDDEVRRIQLKRMNEVSSWRSMEPWKT